MKLLVIVVLLAAAAIAQRPPRQLLISSSNQNSIISANLDGTGVPNTKYLQNAANAGGSALGVSADTVNKKLYIAGSGGSRVYSSSITPFSGSLSTVEYSPSGNIIDVAADPVNNIVFASAGTFNPQLTSSAAGGTNIITNGAYNVLGIDYNPTAGLIYYCERANNNIRSIHPDKSGDTPLFITDQCYDVTYSKDGYLFWTQQGNISPGVMKGPASGGTAQLLYRAETGWVASGIAVDNDLVYWTETQGTTTRVWVGSVWGVWKRVLYTLTGVQALSLSIPSTARPDITTVSYKFNTRQRVNEPDLRTYLDYYFRYLGFGRP